MDMALQILVGLFCVPLTLFGLKSMFKPTSMLEDLAVEPKGIPGSSTVRGMMGGLFLASSGMMGAGLATGETTWFLAVAVLMFLVAVGRLVSLATDGYDKAVVRPIVVELIIVAVLVAAHVRLGAA